MRVSRELAAVKVGQGITIIGLCRTYRPTVCVRKRFSGATKNHM